MTHFMRKHKTLIFWILVLFVGFPMLFFGVDFTAMFDNLTGRDAYGLKPVAQVYDTPITAEALLNELQQMAAQMPNTTTEQLIKNGMAEQALDRLINTVLLEKELEKRDLKLTDDFIVERMKEFPAFQTQTGEFDPKAWNRYVKGQRDQNWKALYASLEQEFARSTLLQVVQASARVLESEVKDEFTKANTKIQVKYAAINPAIEPTDEQLAATYNANPDKYAIPGERTVRFVEFSQLLPVPPVAQEILEKVRLGEDFAELAKQYSATSKENGGEIGWISRASAIGTLREGLFDVAMGEVTQPIEGPGGYYIYKIENERISELTKERDIFVREIQIPAMLSAEQTEELRAKASALHAKAEELGSLEKAAAELGYVVVTTGGFLPDAMSIENVPRSDIFTFKRFTEKLNAGELADVVTAQRNTYVAEVATVGDPKPRTLEEAKDDVALDTIREIRQSPEHLAKLEQLGSDIKVQAASIDEIPVKFPELNVEIKESEPFTIQDMIFTQGISVAAQSIYAEVGEKEPGAFAGPLRGFDGSLYFVQLVSKVGPDQVAWDQKYPEESKRIRQSLEMMRENARLQDYLKQLRDESLANIQTDYEVLAAALGMNKPQDQPEEAAAPAESSAAAAPAAQG